MDIEEHLLSNGWEKTERNTWFLSIKKEKEDYNPNCQLFMISDSEEGVEVESTELACQITERLNQNKCPKCGSSDIELVHYRGSFAVPECDYNYCNECDNQWGHS